MKIVLAGAFGNLGFEILKVLAEKGCEIVAADLKERENNGLEGKYTFRSIDATNPETLKGLCDGAEVANAAVALGMEVYGYDPYLSVNAAWMLSKEVRHASSLQELLSLTGFWAIRLLGNS